MKRILSLLLIFTIILSCSKDTVTPTPTPEPTLKYSLVIAASEGGSVNSTGGTYDKGTKVTVTATPDGEYLFDSWSDGSTENPREITVTSNLDLTANFIKKKYSLSISTSGEGTVTEEVLVQGSVSDYNSGTKVRLTAVPNTDEDWEFIGWEGDVESTNPVIEIDVTEAKTVEAKFMRYFNYMVPSHYWKNNLMDWVDLFAIEELNNFPNEYINNTGHAVADFNGDGYQDVMSQNRAQDGILVGYDFFLNDGSDNYILDNSILINPEFESEKARKTIVGDFNNDGKPDVVRPAGQHDYLDFSHITLSGPNGYEIRVIDVVPQSQYHTLTSGDIDNDGDLDILFTSTYEDGFAINQGNAVFAWERTYDRIANYKVPNSVDGNHGKYGAWTADMMDINNDGNIDIILGGGYEEQYNENGINGPTILWGDGTGYYDFDEKSTFLANNKPLYRNGDNVGNNDDFAIADVDGDGLIDIVGMYSANGGAVYQCFKQISSGVFEDYTEIWFDSNEVQVGNTWILLRDIDSNGDIDLVESEPTISRGADDEVDNNLSIRFEFRNGVFVRIN